MINNLDKEAEHEFGEGAVDSVRKAYEKGKKELVATGGKGAGPLRSERTLSIGDACN